MEQSNSELVIDELKKLNRLMSLLLTNGRGPGEKILLLTQAGLSPKEISEILGVSANSVSVTLYQEKKKKKK